MDENFLEENIEYINKTKNSIKNIVELMKDIIFYDLTDNYLSFFGIEKIITYEIDKECLTFFINFLENWSEYVLNMLPIKIPNYKNVNDIETGYNVNVHHHNALVNELQYFFDYYKEYIKHIKNCANRIEFLKNEGIDTTNIITYSDQLKKEIDLFENIRKEIKQIDISFLTKLKKKLL